ncbi:hypothetical protein pdam_00022032 [Pocillopora damicornis]|uniref:Signal recognition particle subunit SRP68 n=1 Tax=Pocillopora damicornis TaxID=46731 RepID=A0A3M6V0G0_POCDA|nr:hypothetical protein pdam_00022032 [Pocillopora damicornis]
MAATKAVSEAFHVDKETDEVMGETSDEVDPQQAILVQNQMNEPACEPSLKNLNLLPIIRDAQGQHGLRHGDYQRYRQYCQRRLRRLYKTLNFQHGSRNTFKAKKLTQELLKDVKYLHIPLMDAERAWSHAMELKLLANTELRKKFHYIRRLRKAASHATQLEELCSGDVCDARTKLEAQAYASYMKGSVSFELQNWKEAFELFGHAQYCAYNLNEGTTDISDLMQLRWSASSGSTTQDPVLAAKIDEVIAQTREREAAAMTEVSWCGRNVPVKNEKVRSFILHSQQCARELERASTLDSKLTLYDSLLMECKDALQAIKDELKGDTGSGKMRSQKFEAQTGNMQFLHNYVTFIRLSKTVERNLLMAESMKGSLPAPLQKAAEEITVNTVKRLSKPEDLVRIYDIILQNLSDMAELQEIDQDLLFSKEVAAQILECKAHRCLYVAHSYFLGKKWREAMSLYNHVVNLASSAITHFQEFNSLVQFVF